MVELERPHLCNLCTFACSRHIRKLGRSSAVVEDSGNPVVRCADCCANLVPEKAPEANVRFPLSDVGCPTSGFSDVGC